jgi:hypothetical protein
MMLGTATHFPLPKNEHAPQHPIKGYTITKKHQHAEQIFMESPPAKKAVPIKIDPPQRIFNTAPISIKSGPIFILATVCV